MLRLRYCSEQEIATKSNCQPRADELSRSQRESPLEGGDGDEVGEKVDGWLGTNGKDDLDSQTVSSHSGLGSHGACKARMGKHSRRVRNQGMECESLLLF
jgi:hypothetical protein